MSNKFSKFINIGTDESLRITGPDGASISISKDDQQEFLQELISKIYSLDENYISYVIDILRRMKEGD